jgi:hypothetical protein
VCRNTPMSTTQAALRPAPFANGCDALECFARFFRLRRLYRTAMVALEQTTLSGAVTGAKVMEYFGELSPRIDLCPSGHHWGRELQGLGQLRHAAVMRRTPPRAAMSCSNALVSVRHAPARETV